MGDDMTNQERWARLCSYMPSEDDVDDATACGFQYAIETLGDIAIDDILAVCPPNYWDDALSGLGHAAHDASEERRFTIVLEHLMKADNDRTVYICATGILSMSEERWHAIKAPLVARMGNEQSSRIFRSFARQALDYIERKPDYRKARGVLADSADEPAEESTRRLRGDI